MANVACTCKIVKPLRSVNKKMRSYCIFFESAYIEGMDHAAFKSWRATKGWSQQKMADELGISRRMVVYYEDGAYPIPRYIELACRALECEK